MSTKEANSEVAVEKTETNDKAADGKADVKGTKRPAEDKTEEVKKAKKEEENGDRAEVLEEEVLDEEEEDEEGEDEEENELSDGDEIDELGGSDGEGEEEEDAVADEESDA